MEEINQVKRFLDAYSQLPLRSRQILAMRYAFGLGEKKGVTFGQFYTVREVAEVYEISYAMAHKLEMKALRNINKIVSV